MSKLLIAAMAAALLSSSCVGGDDDAAVRRPSSTTTTSTTAVPSERCSAAGLSEDVPEPEGIPVAVAMMRKEILKAAVRCDYELLEALALRGDGSFQYSFGQSGPSGGGEYWRGVEDGSEEPAPLEAMVKVLAMPYAERQFNPEDPAARGDRTYYSWPSADQEERSDEDWDALRSLYSDEEVERFRRFGSYLGYRLGITESGDWIYFVAGD